MLVTRSTKTMMKAEKMQQDGRELKTTPSPFLKKCKEQVDSYSRITWIYLKVSTEIWTDSVTQVVPASIEVRAMPLLSSTHSTSRGFNRL